MIKISRIYKSALSSLKLSDTEKILPTLEALEKAGVERDVIESKLIPKLVEDAEFRNAFLNDPKAAIQRFIPSNILWDQIQSDIIWDQ